MNYKLLIIAAALSATVCSHVVAQFSAGPTASYNFNSFRGNKAFDVIPGYSVGGFVSYRLTDYASPKAELLYARQGGNLIDYPVLGSELYRKKSTVSFHSLQVPLMVDLGLPSLVDAPLKPRLSLGAAYSFVISARERYYNVINFGGRSLQERGYTTVTDQFSRSQFSLVGAIGGEFTMFSMPVSLEFRYLYGLTDISQPGTRNDANLVRTFQEWGNDLRLGTLSFTVQVLLQKF
jgi:hypothetical protein